MDRAKGPGLSPTMTLKELWVAEEVYEHRMQARVENCRAWIAHVMASPVTSINTCSTVVVDL